MELRDAARDGQAQAAALAAAPLLDAEEALEDAFLGARRDARPGVGHRDLDRSPVAETVTRTLSPRRACAAARSRGGWTARARWRRGRRGRTAASASASTPQADALALRGEGELLHHVRDQLRGRERLAAQRVGRRLRGARAGRVDRSGAPTARRSAGRTRGSREPAPRRPRPSPRGTPAGPSAACAGRATRSSTSSRRRRSARASSRYWARARCARSAKPVWSSSISSRWATGGGRSSPSASSWKRPTACASRRSRRVSREKETKPVASSSAKPSPALHSNRRSVVLVWTLRASDAREASVSTTYSQPSPPGSGAAENTTSPPRLGSVPRMG